MRVVPLLLLLSACAGKGASSSDSGDSAALEFCESLADGGRFTIEAVGGSSSSGDLVMHVITNESVNVVDPMYVAFRSYTLENVVLGGVATTGTTTGDGLAEVSNLGAGEWAFEATYSRGSVLCSAALNVDIAAQSTTIGCVVMTCPD